MSILSSLSGIVGNAAGGGGGGGGTPLTAVAFFASATSAPNPITVPTGVLVGDLLVLIQKSKNAALPLPTDVTPAGWTDVGSAVNVTFDTNRTTVKYKIAAGTEGGTTITGMAGDYNNFKVMFVFRGNVPISSATPGSLNSEGTDLNPSPQIVTSGSGTPPLIVIAGYGSGNAINTRSFTPAKDNEVNPNNFLYGAYKIFNSTPVSVIVDMDDEGTWNQLLSFYLSLA